MTAPEAAILELEPQTKKDLEEGSCPSPGGAAATGTCRLAAPGDRHHFVRLWGAYMEEERAGGSAILANDHNLRLARHRFDQVIRGETEGAAAFWSPPGVNQSPEAVTIFTLQLGPDGWQTDYDGREGRGKLATMWGIYVSTPHRGRSIGLALEQFIRPHLVRQGFTHAVTSVRTTNPAGEANLRQWDQVWGIQAVETTILANLTVEDPSHG